MKAFSLATVLFLLLHVLLSGAQENSEGPTREKGPWWPSIWGTDDQAGASNRIDMKTVLRGAQLMKTGKMYELGQVYEAGMPLNEGLTYSLVTQMTYPLGDMRLNSEFVSAQIGQVGTQFDGLGHIGTRVEMADGTTPDVYYNGFTGEEISDRSGLKRLGIEHVRPFLTRGVLVDIAGYKGVGRLNNSYEVTVEDIRGALEKQGMTEDDIIEGDALLFRYGWSELWSEPKQYNSNAPGIGAEVTRWVVERKPSMVGSDSLATEVIPTVFDPKIPLIMHHELLNRHGIFNLENMVFDDLVADGVFEFFFVFTPIRFKGATGSPGRPLAVV